MEPKVVNSSSCFEGLTRLGRPCTPAVIPGAAPPRPKLGRGWQISMHRGKFDKESLMEISWMVLSLKGVSLIEVSLTEINLIQVSPIMASLREREREGLTEESLIEISWMKVSFKEASLITESLTEINLIQVSSID